MPNLFANALKRDGLTDALLDRVSNIADGEMTPSVMHRPLEENSINKIVAGDPVIIPQPVTTTGRRLPPMTHQFGYIGGKLTSSLL